MEALSSWEVMAPGRGSICNHDEDEDDDADEDDDDDDIKEEEDGAGTFASS